MQWLVEMCRGHLTKLKWKSRLNHHENALSTHFNNIGGAVKLRHRLLWATTIMMLRLCDHGIDLHLKMKKKTCKKPHFHNIDTWKSCVRELYEMAVFWYCVSLKQFVYHQKLSTIDSKAGAHFEITMEVEREKKCEQMTKKNVTDFMAKSWYYARSATEFDARETAITGFWCSEKWSRA